MCIRDSGNRAPLNGVVRYVRIGPVFKDRFDLIEHGLGVSAIVEVLRCKIANNLEKALTNRRSNTIRSPRDIGLPSPCTEVSGRDCAGLSGGDLRVIAFGVLGGRYRKRGG